MMIQKQYNLAVAPMRGAYDHMTFDANAVSSGLAFLESELEKRDPMLREPLTNTTYPRDIVIESGGGWVEATSAINVDYSVTGGEADGVGGVGTQGKPGGSGLPAVNPFSKKSFNLTEGLKLMQTNPEAAKQLQEAAKAEAAS